MSNDQLVCFRTDEATKRRISLAAYSQGLSTTGFLRRTVMQEVENIENKKVKPHGLKWSLERFCAACAEAGQGGASGFRNVGKEFAWLVQHELGKELADGKAKVTEFRKMLQPATAKPPEELIEDDQLNAAVWGWFSKIFGESMDLIPMRRREQFFLGVYEETWERTGGRAS